MERLRYVGCVVTTVIATSALQAHGVMTLDLDTMWDFGRPAVSEQRFRDALATASADQQLILQTQIARSWGLRRDFDKAREVLASIAPAIASASAEARVRYHLELGRTHASAAHPKASRTPDSTQAARTHFLRAFELAEQSRLDSLAIDALHMMVFVDVEPAQQLAWNERALAYLERSDQPAAQRWEGPLRNNVGYAYHEQGDYEAALRQFRLSRAAYERAGRVNNVRIADWMIARTLRVQGKPQQALAIQLQLEQAWDAAGEPDPYVYEELEQLYRALGNDERASHYAARLAAARNKP